MATVVPAPAVVAAGNAYAILMLAGDRPDGDVVALGVGSASLRSRVLEWHRAYPLRVSAAQLTSWLCFVGSGRSEAADTCDGAPTAAVVMTATLAAAAVSTRRMVCTPGYPP